MQKRLKEAFAVARHLTSEEAAKQHCYYDRKAGAVALQPGNIVMVHTNGFVGKRKVKDQWEDGGFIVESQLEDWPIYKVKCLTSDNMQKPKYQVLHQNPNCLKCHPGDFFSRSRSRASTILGDLTRRWTDLTGVVEWQIPY